MEKPSAKFQELLKLDQYQVFLFACPAHIPLSMWTHPWFVINKKGVLSRYEVRYKKNTREPKLGHIHRDDLPPFDGIEIFSFVSRPRWTATLLGELSGGDGSEAERMALYIEETVATYSDKERYFLLGPNSNTYIRHILDRFPAFPGKLTARSLGKDYGKIPLGIVHGRFQPPHNGHIRYILSALSRAKHVIIGICTPEICSQEEADRTGYPCTKELNPFSYNERLEMIRKSLADKGVSSEKYSFVDFPSDYKNIDKLIPKEAVFLMSVTGTPDTKKAEYIAGLGFRTETVYEMSPASDRERSGTVRMGLETDTQTWQDIVPEAVALFLKKRGRIDGI